MKQARHALRLWSLIILYGIYSLTYACQQTGPLQGPVAKPGDKKGDKDKEDDDAESERITPPNNIVGSYLVCQEQEQLTDINQNANLHCGVYMEPGHRTMPVTNLTQWQLTGTTTALRAVSPGSASVVELKFQGNDLNALRTSIKRAKLRVQDDAGDVFEGLVADLVPADSRFSSANATKTANLTSVWAEGFEGQQLTSDYEIFYNPHPFTTSALINWVNPASQTALCGTPVYEIMRRGSPTDPMGAAEGTQFIETDGECWPETSNTTVQGPSNLSIGKDLTLAPGRVYHFSFKVRQPPLPAGADPVAHGLQIKINGNVVKDLRTFTGNWQEITFDWVGGSGVAGLSKIELVDVGASNDCLGVLLDDLRIAVENF